MKKEELLTTRELHLKRKSMWDQSLANHQKYIDESTGLFKAELLEYRECPSCTAGNHSILFNKSGGTYVICNDCAMVFLNPVFKDEELEKYYRNNHDLQSTVVAQDFGFYRGLYTKGMEAIQKHFKGPGNNILDIGCSAGGFLNIAKEMEWNTHGLEFNRQEAALARTNGHEIFEMDLKSFAKENKKKFEVITLWDVFEHIKDGYSLLKQASEVLSQKGGVFIQSPTPTALAARILQEKCNMFDGVEHVNLYTLDNIKNLAEKTGFDIESYCTVISEQGVIHNYLNYQDPYLGQTKSRLDLFNEEFILSKNLGYKFQIFLRKK